MSAPIIKPDLAYIEHLYGIALKFAYFKEGEDGELHDSWAENLETLFIDQLGLEEREPYLEALEQTKQGAVLCATRLENQAKSVLLDHQRSIKKRFIPSLDFVPGEVSVLPIISEPGQLTFSKLEAFLIRPAINIAGLCGEADVSQIYLNRCRARGVLPGKKFMDKLLPVMKKYGF